MLAGCCQTGLASAAGTLSILKQGDESAMSFRKGDVSWMCCWDAQYPSP